MPSDEMGYTWSTTAFDSHAVRKDLDQVDGQGYIRVQTGKRFTRQEQSSYPTGTTLINMRKGALVVNKSQLAESVAATHANFQKDDVELAVDAVFAYMTAALVRGDRIEIRGVGSFSIKTRDAREGRNPKTGEKIFVPRKTATRFTPGKELKERVAAGRR